MITSVERVINGVNKMKNFKTGETRGYISVKVFEGRTIIGTILALDSIATGNNDKGFMFHSRDDYARQFNYKVFKTIAEWKHFLINQ